MKCFLTTLAALLGGTLAALPVGNPGEASLVHEGVVWDHREILSPDCCFAWCNLFSLRGGYYGDQVFNRHMQNRGSVNTSQLEEFNITTHAGYLALNFCDRLDVFGLVGTSAFSMEGNLTSFSPFLTAIFEIQPGARIDVESREGLAWGMGVRATLWQYGCTTVGIVGEYFRTEPRISRVTDGTLFSTYTSGTIPHLRGVYTEWQVALGATSRIGLLLPYAALKWSTARLLLENRGPISGFFPIDGNALITFYNLGNRKSWGYAVGTSILICESVLLTLEGRFIDESALYINGQFRF